MRVRHELAQNARITELNEAGLLHNQCCTWFYCKSRTEVLRLFAFTREQPTLLDGQPGHHRFLCHTSYGTAHASMTRHINQAAREATLPASAGTPMRAAAIKYYNPRPSVFGLPLGIQTTSVVFIELASTGGQTGRLSRIASKTANATLLHRELPSDTNSSKVVTVRRWQHHSAESKGR